MRWVFLVVLILVVISLVLSLSLTLGRRTNVANPVVETNLGRIVGLHEEDGDYSMFLGIPYAKVNVSNPFGVSSPHPEFTETFQAFDDTAICPQREEFNNTITGTLDCLHLNIYVPNTADHTSKLPVLVWIYGGGYRIGYAGRYLYGPKFFMKQEVILVTVNYRLGPYGFMCLDTPEVPGNQGLKDQLIALRWIKDHIGAFNGDDKRITLMGESAGAIAIEFNLLSNHEKNYNQVILQSGSSLISYLMTPSQAKVPLELAEHLGFITGDLNEALSFLAQSDTDSVIAAHIDLGIDLRVCVEKQFENVDIFVSKHPEFSDFSKVKNMSILSGFNSHERMAIYVNIPSELFINQSNVFHQRLSLTFDTENDFDDMIDIVRRFYIGDELVSDAVRWDIIDFDSDLTFNHPVQRSIKKFVDEGANVYQYLFSYSGDRNFVKMRQNITAEGAAHADEIGYMFDMSFVTEEPSAEDQLIIDRLTTLWANFVKYGDPTPEVTELLPVKWSPITTERAPFVTIDSEMTAGLRPYHDRMAFWDLFFTANHDKNVARQEAYNRN